MPIDPNDLEFAACHEEEGLDDHVPAEPLNDPAPPPPRALTPAQRREARRLRRAPRLGRLRDLHGCQLGLSQLALVAVDQPGRPVVADALFGPLLSAQVRVSAEYTDLADGVLSARRAGHHVLAFGAGSRHDVPFLHRLAMRHLALAARQIGTFALRFAFDSEAQQCVAIFSADPVSAELEPLLSELYWQYSTPGSIARAHATVSTAFPGVGFAEAVAAWRDMPSAGVVVSVPPPPTPAPATSLPPPVGTAALLPLQREAVRALLAESKAEAAASSWAVWRGATVTLSVTVRLHEDDADRQATRLRWTGTDRAPVAFAAAAASHKDAALQYEATDGLLVLGQHSWADGGGEVPFGISPRRGDRRRRDTRAGVHLCAPNPR